MSTSKFKDNDRTSFGYTLGLISGKWKLLIIFYLHHQPTLRYGELHRLLSRITHKTLSQTLKELEVDGLILRTQYPEIPLRVEYQLTANGESLFPIIQSMCQWGDTHRP